MLHVFCRTPSAVLLLGVKDDRGVLRFPFSANGVVPGLCFEVLPLAPIGEQLVRAASEALSAPVGLSLTIQQEFADVMTLPNGSEATVYLATISAPHARAHPNWPSMPEMLRGMDKDRRRLPYLRAWQVLTGGLQLNTKVVDMDEVQRYLDE